ncbi:UNVERIFIED_CONTAM: GPI transamidase component PIG-T [Sesamum angustifolium]|uniref:GPI transamidase component PIG-T n=1 Tax=Sesamum angustifolium TaxID=2727405 RepID=A0AAW2QPI9_9LAMI
MSCFKSIFLFFLVLFSASETIASCEDVVQVSEEFTEALLLRPLPDRKVLAHFHFQSTAPPSRTYGRHHHLFPKSIYQLVHKFKVREMELSFTQGRWNYERWGGYDPISNSNAKPPGVELWADFDVPQHQVEDSWKNLTHALSGLFCASINFLEQSTSYSAPQWSFQSLSGKLRYGTLPREAVCTENLTPWLKLLPCRDKAGLSSLMDRPSIYRSYYHSQRLHLRSDEFDTSKTSTGIVLEQTLTVVLQPNTFSGKISQPSWSLSSLFGRKVSGKCSLSNSILRLPCSVSTAALTLEFDKGFLHIDEYPPDANQGFDIPSAVVRFNDFVTNISFDDNSLKRVPILSKLEENIPVLIHGSTTRAFDYP